MINQIINDVSVYSIAIPFVIGIYTYRYLGLFSKQVFLIVGLGILTELAANLIKPMNNFPVINAYFIVEYFLVAYIFCDVYCTVDSTRLIKLVSALFLVFALINFFFIQGMFELNSLTLLFKSVIITALAIFAFQQLLKEEDVNLVKNPLFYFASGLLIYYVGNMFTFGYGVKYFNNPEAFSFDIWNIHAVFNIIFNLSLTLSLWFGRMKITT